jgi:hypothetical protein
LDLQSLAARKLRIWAFPGMQAAGGELQLRSLARRWCRQPINPSLHPVGLVGPKNANQSHPLRTFTTICSHVRHGHVRSMSLWLTLGGGFASQLGPLWQGFGCA